MDLDDAKQRVRAYLEAFRIGMEPTGTSGEWRLVRLDPRDGSTEPVRLIMPDRLLRGFLKESRGDAELLGVLIDEELSTDGRSPTWIALRRGFPRGVGVISDDDPRRRRRKRRPAHPTI